MPTFRQDTKIGGMVPMIKTDDINDQAITKDKIRDGNITSEKLADGAVSTDKLPDGAIKTPKLADENITTSKLAEASVVTSKIADQNVTKEKIADQSVDNSKLSPSAVTYDKVKDKAIITEKLNDRAVTTEKVEEKAITNAKIGDSAVDGRVISEASVEKKHLANDSVATEKLQDSAITSDKIHIHAVTEEKIENSAISNSKLADNSVGTSKIKDGNVTNEKVANNTLTIDKFDPELRKSIQAATGLPENLVEVIQDVDVEVKSLHTKDEDLQSQITDKQQQITANDKDIQSLQNRSTQMEQSINNIAVTGGASVANTVAYSNTASGLVSINAQGAIDELAAKNATKAEKTEVATELEKKFDKESILQESGDSEDKVMSQKAVSTKLSKLNDELAKKFNSENIAQESGESEDKVMSQKAVSESLVSTLAGIHTTITPVASGINVPLNFSFVKGYKYRVSVRETTNDYKIRFYLRAGSTVQSIALSAITPVDSKVISIDENSPYGIVYAYFGSEMPKGSIFEINIDLVKTEVHNNLGDKAEPISQLGVTSVFKTQSGVSSLTYTDNAVPSDYGTKIYAPLEVGKMYDVKISRDDERITDFDIRTINTNTDYTTLSSYPYIVSEPNYGFCIYYGSKVEKGEVTVEIKEVDYPSEYTLDNRSLLPFIRLPKYSIDSSIKVSYKTPDDAGTTGTIITDYDVTVKPKSYYFLFIKVEDVNWNLLTDIARAWVVADGPKTAIISLNLNDNINDPIKYGIVHKFNRLSLPNGATIFELHKVLNNISQTGYVRLSIDNRETPVGGEAIVVKKVFLWKNSDVSATNTTSGLLSDIMSTAYNKLNNIQNLNLCPSVSNFDIIKGTLEQKTKKSFIFTSSNNYGTVGFNFLLEKSGMTYGDKFQFFVTTGEFSNNDPHMYVYATYYNKDNRYISRNGKTLVSNKTLCVNGTIPNDTYYVKIEIQIYGDNTINIDDMYFTISDYRRETIPSNTLSGIVTIPVGLPEPTIPDKLNVVFVDAMDGNDSNDGTTLSKAFKTFSKAFSVLSDDGTIMLNGDISERFDIHKVPTQRSLRLIGVRGTKMNRIIGGTKIDSATHIEGDVYSSPLNDFSNEESFWIYQHEVQDGNTLIPDNERHPLQRGKKYRCDSSKIVRGSSLDDVKTSDSLKFYYDADNQTLYFKIKNGTNLNSNPVYIPSDLPNVYGNDGSVKFEMSGIESWYGGVFLRKCHGGKVVDCASKYVYGSGAFSIEDSIGLELIRCEAASCTDGSVNGDGFGVHILKNEQPVFAKKTTVTMIDCWSHDNNDDGYSDHGGCEGTIIGGLFEYNVKGGLTPSYGAHDTYKNCYTRKNKLNGIFLCGNATDGGIGGQAECFNCISENNSINYNCDHGEVNNPNQLTLINCISKKGIRYGYISSASSYIRLVDCYDNESTEVKGGKTSNIIVEHSSLVQ